MKRSLFTKQFKQTMLAVPAAALMLGAAQAGTTVGLNFQQWYYDSGNNPQTIGFNNGYSAYNTTGLPVTTNAFGVNLANWFNTDPMGSEYNANPVNQMCTFSGVTTFAGGLSCNVNAPDGAHASGVGCPFASGVTFPSYAPGVWTTPGANEVFWGNILGDDANPFSVSVSGLASKFPNGYVVFSLAAHGGYNVQTNLPNLDFTDGTTTSTEAYHITIVHNSPAAQWPYATVGISDPSGVFTADTLYLNSRSDGTGFQSPLAGFIITDQPVVSQDPVGGLLLGGGTVSLSATVAALPNSLFYQWRTNGVPIAGANSATYVKTGATVADSANYDLVVTNLYGSTTSAVANVFVVPSHASQTSTWDASLAVTGAQDGSGTWAYANTNWWNGSLDDYWNPTDSAVFGAGGTGAYTVTLGDNLTANAITFNSGAYTITNNSGLTLALQGATTITANTNGTISSPLSTGTNTFVKAGARTLTISGTLTCNSNIFVSAGTLQVLAKNGDSPYIVTNGATLKIGYSTAGGSANTAMQIYGDGASATTGFYLAGGHTYNVNGGVVVVGAPTTIRQYGSGMASLGFFDINQNPGLSITAAASGSATDTNIQLVSDGYGMVVTTAAGAHTATGDLIINGPLNVNANNGVYGLYAKGTGSVLLNAVANTTNCALQIKGGTVICGISNCIGTNALLNVSSGATLNLNGTSQKVGSAVLAGTLKMTIKKGGSPNCNTLTSLNQPAAYGGTLMVTNVGGPLTLGDSFLLFPYVGTGAFTTLILPALPNGLAWQDYSAVDGTIDVIAGSVPPSIVNDLSGGTNYAYVGGNTTFAITVSGDPILQYQWRQNGSTVVGLNSPTLALTSLSLGSGGNYSCTVTNNYGVAQSQTNYLLVTTPGLVQAAMVQDAPASFWPLNETNPSTAYDYWAGNNGLQNGSLTLGVAGPIPPADAGFSSNTTAYLFDGASTYIDLGTGPALSGTNDFTLEAWVNTLSGTYGQVIQQRSSAGFVGEYQFGINGNGTLYFMVYGSGGYQFTFNSTNTSHLVNDGNWHHIAAVRSGTNGLVYVDGSLVGSASGAVEPLAPLAVYIGADLRGSSSYFNGTMCDVAIYSHALSPARIVNHALAGIVGGPLTLNLVGTNLVWPVGTLLSTPVLGPSAVWTPVSGAASPYSLPPAGSPSSAMFYRLQL